MGIVNFGVEHANCAKCGKYFNLYDHVKGDDRSFCFGCRPFNRLIAADRCQDCQLKTQELIQNQPYGLLSLDEMLCDLHQTA